MKATPYTTFPNQYVYSSKFVIFPVTFLREFVVWGHVARVGALAPHGGDLDVPRLKMIQVLS